MEISPIDRESADIDMGTGWRHIWREDVEAALHRVEASESCDVASPARGVPPLDESQLRAVLAVMDDTRPYDGGESACEDHLIDWARGVDW